MRTVSEMRSHLRDKGYEKEEIEETIREFKTSRYLDDAQYVMAYAEYAYGKSRGSKRIRSELAQKGISMEIIGNALEDYKYENDIDEREIALKSAKRIVELELDGGKREFDRRLSSKVARRLDSLGYDSGMIFGILSELQNAYGSEEY